MKVKDELTVEKWGKRAITALLVIVGVFIFNPVRCVGATERGVIKTFGRVDDTKTLSPGIQVKAPFFQSIKKYDLTPKTIKVKIPVGDAGAVSLDKQTIGVGGSINWRYDETQIIKIATTYSSDSVLADQTSEIIITAIKNTIGQYNIDTIVRDQDSIANKAKEASATRLAYAGLPVIITALNLNNWDWSEDYDKMIKETVAMQQAAQRAEAELRMVEQTSQKQRIEAEAAAAATVAKAQGRKQAAELDADAKRAEGQGIADYNRLIAQNLNIELEFRRLEIQLERAKRWNGVEVATYLPLNPAGGIVTLPSR